MRWSFLFVIACIGCKGHRHTEAVLPDMTAITKDYYSWWIYTSGTIHLDRSFETQNEYGEPMDSKHAFLDSLSTGKFIPIQLLTKENIEVYRLFSLNTDHHRDFVETIKQLARDALDHQYKEGKNLPFFNAKDIQGRGFTTDSLKGKITVLKTWFIHCLPCVQEFPKLNHIVDSIGNNLPIQFISLARDSPGLLRNFLKTRTFKYRTVGDVTSYLDDSLKIQTYPTHFIIGKNGKILKVMNTVDDLEYWMKQLNIRDL